MKREALNHPKMLDLASRLNISRAHTVGILTLLFDFTASYAPQGDVGKHRDGAIARACDWMECPEVFITALVDAGWLDRDDKCRLIVHDWAEHCENWVRAKLYKLNLPFAGEKHVRSENQDLSAVSSTPESGLKSALDSGAEASYGASFSRDLAQPSPAQPSLANPKPSPASPSQAKPAGAIADDAGAEAAIFGLMEGLDMDEVRRQASKLRKAAPGLELDYVWESAVIAETIKPGFLSEVATGIKTNEIRKAKPYIDKAFRGECEERGVSLAKLRARVPACPVTANS